MDNMSNKGVTDKDSIGNLLGPQERRICEQIAAGGPPHNQRAQSLLAIDAGVTQKTAALQSGQTVGQVSYWLGKFRREGMSIFPEELMLQIEPETPLEEKKEGTKKKSKKFKASKKTKKGKKSPAAEAKPKKGKVSKKTKKGKKNGKKKRGKKSKKRKKKQGKKK